MTSYLKLRKQPLYIHTPKKIIQPHPEKKKYGPFDTSDITIVLQGIINKDVDIFHSIHEYSKYAKIVLSLYDSLPNRELAESIRLKYPDTTFVFTDYEKLVKENSEKYGSVKAHKYNQIHTTLKGIEHVTTQYLVKSRVDNFYSGIDKFISHGIQSKKIISSSSFLKGYSTYMYHLSDCLFAGTTEQVKTIFKFADTNFSKHAETVPAEVMLWKPYIEQQMMYKGVDPNGITLNTYIDFLSSILTVYCVNLHTSYIVKSRDKIYKKVQDIDQSDKEYFQYGFRG